MFFVYEVDFLRELKDVIANGMQVASLEVRPFGGLSGVSEFFADFNWQPDGRYATFVRCAVLVYLAHIMAHERPLVPHWLLEDLVSLGASFTPRGNATERCIAGLKSSILASKTNRTGGGTLHVDNNLQIASVTVAVQIGVGGLWGVCRAGLAILSSSITCYPSAASEPRRAPRNSLRDTMRKCFTTRV